MYRLPSDFDPARLVGCALEQVSFSQNTVHLAFSGNVSITIESCFQHSTRGAPGNAERTSLPVRESRLMLLLGQLIESAHVSEDGTLTLKFADGQTLSCFDDTPQYEAYKIKFGDEEIVV